MTTEQKRVMTERRERQCKKLPLATERMTPTPRTLDSLTEDEAATCFRLAFGQEADKLAFKFGPDDGYIFDSYYDLEITNNGKLKAYHFDGDSNNAVEINAVKLVRYLDSLGIQWGDDEPG